ncbi:hypothetical protein LTR17_009675 [Elasticomyces elasticus]|nr:hypothetical protein LTR17_009675 [Elasticomyces elasticus]
MLVSLCALGEKLINPTFHDRVLDALVAGTQEYVVDTADAQSRWFPGKETVGNLYSSTPKGSPARRLMVDLYVIHGHAPWIDTENPEANSLEFLVDLTAAMFNNRVLTGARRECKELAAGTPCSYHKHPKDEKCVV